MGRENSFGIPANIWETMVERTATSMADLLDSAPQFQMAAAVGLLEDALTCLPSAFFHSPSGERAAPDKDQALS